MPQGEEKRAQPQCCTASHPLERCPAPRAPLAHSDPRAPGTPCVPDPHAPGVRGLPAAAHSAQCRGSKQDSSARSGAMWPGGDASRAGARAPSSGLRERLGRARGCPSAGQSAAAASSRPPVPGPPRGAAACTAGSKHRRLPAAGEWRSRRAIVPRANCRRVGSPERRRSKRRGSRARGRWDGPGGGHTGGVGRGPARVGAGGAACSGAGRGAGECSSVLPGGIGSATRSHSWGSERPGPGYPQSPGLPESDSS